LLPFVPAADPVRMSKIAPLVQERIKLLSDVSKVADFFFEEPKTYIADELIPQKGDRQMAIKVLQQAQGTLATTHFSHAELDAALRADAERLKIKPGQMFQPIRVAVCGRKTAPPLFETLEVIGQQGTLGRIDRAIKSLFDQNDHESHNE